MCSFTTQLRDICHANMLARKSFKTLDVRDALRSQGTADAHYRECQYETLTYIQHNGASYNYIARSVKVADEQGRDQYVWEFVYSPASYDDAYPFSKTQTDVPTPPDREHNGASYYWNKFKSWIYTA